MIIAIGDVHGKFRELKIKIRAILNDTPHKYGSSGFIDTKIHFVQVGDFGLGFDSPLLTYNELLDLDNDLIFAGAKLWIIRGNHDNPSFWGKSGYKFDNIHFINDDTILRIDDKLCYFAGGGVSIDRSKRIHGVSYWENEFYYFNDQAIYGAHILNQSIDVLFTHDVYMGASPLTFLDSPLVKEWTNRDKKLEEDLIAQQFEIKTMYEHVLKTNNKLKWYHGHYHQSYSYYTDDTLVCCLDELEFKEIL